MHTADVTWTCIDITVIFSLLDYGAGAPHDPTYLLAAQSHTGQEERWQVMQASKIECLATVQQPTRAGLLVQNNEDMLLPT